MDTWQLLIALSWRGLIVASMMLGVTHLTLSPVAEEVNEESEESSGGMGFHQVSATEKRRQSRAVRRYLQRLCSKHHFVGRPRTHAASPPLPGQFSAAQAARNGFGGPLLA